MARNHSQLTGTAGEHYVAFRLSQMGFVVALPRGGSPAVDLLASNVDGTKTITVQVKTTEGALRERGRGAERSAHHLEFPLGHKAANLAADRYIYVFVDLMGRKPTSHPVAYVVPSSVIKAYCGSWTATAKMVRWHPSLEHAERYRENWQLIADQLT